MRGPFSLLGGSALDLLSKGLRGVELLFWPSSCRVCGRLLDRPGERVVCFSCLRKIEPRRASFCSLCGRFFDGASAPHVCRRCLEARPLYSLHRSCGPYEGNLRELIILMKFRGFSVLAKDLAGLARSCLGDQWRIWSGLEGLIPVPLHPRRLRSRGFNQAEALARDIGRAKGIPVRAKALARTRNTPAQTSLEALDRRRNLAGAFVVRRPAEVRGKTLLLVDDVYTTGSTIRECCRVLKRAGAREVRALTLARTRSNR